VVFLALSIPPRTSTDATVNRLDDINTFSGTRERELPNMSNGPQNKWIYHYIMRTALLLIYSLICHSQPNRSMQNMAQLSENNVFHRHPVYKDGVDIGVAIYTLIVTLYSIKFTSIIQGAILRHFWYNVCKFQPSTSVENNNWKPCNYNGALIVSPNPLLQRVSNFDNNVRGNCECISICCYTIEL
jgi:hypothetical protein